MLISNTVKVTDFSIFAGKKFQKTFEAGSVCQVSFVYVIVTNNVNWHRENLWSEQGIDRDNFFFFFFFFF